tara:strand:+ start:29 stop:1219 length:1191 start_codon:yes stop_codon:yes gene_type:complete
MPLSKILASSIAEGAVGGGHEYVSLTGTSQTLDLSQGNYFDGGTLSGNTTLTFSNVPTEHRWTYTYKSGGADASGDVTKLNFSKKHFFIGNDISASTGMTFKPDGTEMYICGGTDEKLYQYTLSTAYNIATASLTNTKTVGGAGSAQNALDRPQGVYFKSDGTKMILSQTSPSGGDPDGLQEWDLSTAWDISTASFVRERTYSPDLDAGDIVFKSDGTKALMIQSDNIYEYTLSTGWNISTLTQTDTFQANGTPFYFTEGRAMGVSSDGTKVYVADRNTRQMKKIVFATGWDVSSTVSSSTSSNAIFGFDLLFQIQSSMTGMFLKSDESVIWVNGDSTDSVYEYKFSDLYTVTLPNSVQNNRTLTLFPDQTNTLEFYTADGGTNVFLINETQTENK